MLTFPLPRFEQQRKEVLHRYEILSGGDDTAVSTLAKTAAMAFEMPMVLGALTERYRPWIKCSHGLGINQSDQIEDFCVTANLSTDSFVVEDVRSDPYFAYHPAVIGRPNIAFFAGAPVRNPEGRRLGTLCLMDTMKRTLTPEQVLLLRSFADMFSAEVCLRAAGRYAVRELISAEEEKCNLYDMAMTDPLTKALNRRAFFHLTKNEVGRAIRHGHPLSTVIIDIDHFKRVNDTHGHAVGDEVIRRVAEVIQKTIRDEDYFGRIGGEEFALVLPHTRPQDAAILANRVRHAIGRLSFNGDGVGFSVTSSFGVSRVEEGDSSIDPALEAADRALYRAKTGGRNRVEIDFRPFTTAVA